jgi:hypothetical protein
MRGLLVWQPRLALLTLVRHAAVKPAALREQALGRVGQETVFPIHGAFTLCLRGTAGKVLLTGVQNNANA